MESWPGWGRRCHECRPHWKVSGAGGEAYPDSEIVLVLDGASPHWNKGVFVPDNIQLIFLTPYLSELNTAEILWRELGEGLYSSRLGRSR
jgi:transposase